VGCGVASLRPSSRGNICPALIRRDNEEGQDVGVAVMSVFSLAKGPVISLTWPMYLFYECLYPYCHQTVCLLALDT
jgi:hypothetical protein